MSGWDDYPLANQAPSTDPWAAFPLANAPKTAAGQSPASTMRYIGTHGLGGLLEGGKQLGIAAAIEMGQPRQQADMQALPSGQQTANQMVYGQPNVLPPNGFAQYGGAVANALGSNPVMAYMAPGYTVAGALGGEGGSDINKAYGSPVSDPIARLLGSTVATPAWALTKAGIGSVAQDILPGTKAGNAWNSAFPTAAVNAPSTDSSIVQRAAQLQSDIQSGQGEMGKYQLIAQAARNSLALKKPSMPDGAQIPMNATTDVLTKQRMGPSLPSSTTELTNSINTGNGNLPAGAVQDWMNEYGGQHQELYNALKSDLKDALVLRNGPDAAANFDQANAASRAIRLLNKSVNQYGYDDPVMLSRQLNALKMNSPSTYSLLTNASPETSAMANQAGKLAQVGSPAMKANPVGTGNVAKMAGAAALMGTGRVTGIPGTDLLAGMLLESGEGYAGNPLYKIPQPNFIARATGRVVPGLLPSLMGGGASQ